MSTLSSRRLNFVLKERTQSWVALRTGYSQSSISKWSRGITTVPTKVYRSIRNNFQSEAYNRLRRVGAPTHQARRFSSFAPESVGIKMGNYVTMAKDFTMGAVGKWADANDIPVTRDLVNTMWNEMQERVLEGMRKSSRTWEEWRDYIAEKYGVD